MWELLKELFSDYGKKIRTPQVLGFIAILMLIFKVVFTNQFNNLYLVFVNGIGKFGFILNVFQVISIMLLFTSIIVFLAALLFTIAYLITSIITDTKTDIPKCILNLDDTIHRFFIGSKIAIVNVNAWFLVTLSYFYICNEKMFIDYRIIISDFVMKSSVLIKALFGIYSVVLFYSFLILLEHMLYKFLYFRLDDETEKKLYDLKEKY